MSPELVPLVLAAFLQLIQIPAYATAMTRENGLKYNLSPRDAEPEIGLVTGRLKRAAANHAEALLLYAIAVVLAGKSSQVTLVAAWSYLAARLLYVPAYALAWVPWRSVFFVIGAISTIILLVAALL